MAFFQPLASQHADVTFINTQGTLDPVAGSWHNELHPSKAGFNKLGPENSDSLPLPLLILAGLALLLIAAGAAGIVSRRLRARKTAG